jgi:hypothetical protein
MMERWQAAQASLVNDVGDIMAENKEQVIALNTDQLYEMGADNNNSPLPAYKDPIYAKMKEQMRGKAITDLYLTGAFQAGFNLTVSNGVYSLNSTDEKADMLRERYAKRGYNIFGLTMENKTYAWSKILRTPYVYRLGDITKCTIA